MFIEVLYELVLLTFITPQSIRIQSGNALGDSLHLVHTPHFGCFTG